jgi:DNA-binding SARP family transcriptional activator
VTLLRQSPLVGLELVCFGPPTAHLADGPPPPEVLWRKHLALLIYLALSPNRTRNRQHLLGLLWPEKDEQAARHSLNEAIRRLRTGLGVDRIVSEGNLVTLNDLRLTVDALEFERAVSIDRPRALELLRGDFLEGFDVGGVPAFDEWAAHQRERYRAIGAALLVEQGEVQLLDSRTGDAQELGRRALALEPYSEPAVRLCVRAAALGGDAVGALAAYHAFGNRLKAELQEQPSRELVALSERVRRDRWRGVAARHADSALPLVGRVSQRKTALSAVADGLASGPVALVIAGDTGSGRTRLLAECADRLMLDGAVVAVVRPLESDHDAPWSTLRALMRAGLSHASGIAGTEPAALGMLGAIVPELADRVAVREPRDRAEVGGALASLLHAIADESPVALAVDDAHFADGPSIEALHSALRAVGRAPVVLIISILNVIQVGGPELLALRGATGRSLQGVTVRLGAFTLEEVRELVRLGAPWCRDAKAADRLTRRLAFDTGGNPLLAVTLLRALQENATLREDILAWPIPGATMDSPLPISVPVLARLAITARITPLDEPSRRVLAVASVLGLALDTDLIAQLANSSRAAVEDLLPAMERVNLLAFDGERYAFAAPLIAQVVRAEFLTPGQQRTLRQRAVVLLASRGDLESRVLRAELMARVEPGEVAFAEAAAVARDALAGGAPRTASRALAAAERSSGEHAAGRGDLERLRGQLRELVGTPGAAR